MFLSHSTRHGDTIPVRFHCPACGERDVDGTAWTMYQHAKLLWLVTVLEERVHWVKCSCCERQLLSRLAPHKLAELDPEDVAVERFLKDRVPPGSVALLVGAYLFAVMPVVGPFFLFLAWISGGTSRPGFRLACRVCLYLHVFAMNAFAVLAMMNSPER